MRHLEYTVTVRAIDDIVAVAKAEYEGSAQLREEFIDLRTYTAWRKGDAAGLVKVLGERKVSLSDTQTQNRVPSLPAREDIVAVAKAEYEGSAQLREEFIDLRTYTAWRKGDAAGLVKVLGQPRR